MLEQVKKDLRISHDKLDTDIQENIEACKLDMQRVGIDTTRMDALMTKAVKLYLRWQYNYENQADRYGYAYQQLRNALSLSKKYKKGREQDV